MNNIFLMIMLLNYLLPPEYPPLRLLLMLLLELPLLKLPPPLKLLRLLEFPLLKLLLLLLLYSVFFLDELLLSELLTTGLDVPEGCLTVAWLPDVVPEPVLTAAFGLR